MNADLPSGNVLQNDKRFLAALDEVARIKNESVVRQLNFYRKHARTPMLLFRVSGVFVILLSVSLPFLTTFEVPWKTTALSVISLSIAGLTGLNAFFRWESNWKGYRQTQYTLDYLIAMWELRIAEARCQLDVQKAIDIALQATGQLLSAARAATDAETEEYFQRVQTARTQQS